MIILWIGIIARTKAESHSTYYKVQANKRAELEIISVVDSSGMTECTVRCQNTEGCSHVNWVSTSGCQLLRNTTDEIVLIDDADAVFLCMYPFLKSKTKAQFEVSKQAKLVCEH